MADKQTTDLIIKCIQFYIDCITVNGSKCPSMDEMRELVKLDDILKNVSK